jgi:carbamoyl-phosphate synthase large subunit
VEKGRTERRADLEAMAHSIVAAIPSARGVLCFQTILDRDRGMAVFEINARFGGGYPIADHAGAEFALWLLEETKGLPCSAHNAWRDGVTMLRYDAAVFDG